MFQGGLHGGYPGLEGSGGEAWSSHSCGGEYRSFDVSDMLVEEQLVSGVTGRGGRDPDMVVASSVVGAGLAPPLLNEDSSGLKVGVGIGEAGRDVGGEEW